MATQTATDLAELARQLAQAAKVASRSLAIADTAAKNGWLRLAAARLRTDQPLLLEANAEDLARAADFGLTQAQIDRLKLTPQRIDGIAAALEEIAELPDTVGESIESFSRPNGLQITKRRVPLGVILFIFESRPNVTSDAAGVCVKSGNAVILRGGKEAAATNQAIHRVLSDALDQSGLPRDAVQLVTNQDYELINELLQQQEWINLVIPRGGEGLIRRVAQKSRIPVLKHYQGICHIYVHSEADLQMASEIVVNAKCQRPGVCNAVECLLVDETISQVFLPDIVNQLRDHNVIIYGCEKSRQLVPDLEPADSDNFATEYLELKISLRVVSGLDQAVDHIATYGSEHTDTIVTASRAAADEFLARVDSAVVMVNASTRFNDGGEFGFGAEVGISTDRLHARGPCGIRELTTYKYVVNGSGQVRN